MPTLQLRFPARRYHATPWGHHVNEGQIEWPPSPWRLLRALLATGYAKRHWPAEGPPDLARSLISKLASVLPHYRLPDAVGAHSRHYMPLARFKNAREDTTLVFDTWAQIDHGTLGVRWDVALTADESEELAALAHHVGYLGRSESWIEAELLGDDSEPGFDVRPGEARDCPGPGWEQIALLAPIPSDEYASWSRAALAQALTATGIDLGKKKHSGPERKKLDAAIQTIPADLIACLQVDTAWLHKLGWSQPPGSRKCLYWRRKDSLESAAPKPRPTAMTSTPIPCMLLSITSASGNRGNLPRIERTLPQGELLHRALMANAHKAGAHSVVLSGCDDDGQPLTSAHQHAHLLHLDLDDDGHLDHVLIWAPMGLDAHAQTAIRATRRTYTKGTVGALQLALAASGNWSDLLSLPGIYGKALARLIGSPAHGHGSGQTSANPANTAPNQHTASSAENQTGNSAKTTGATRWRSLTPFVPPRFLKKRGKNTLEGQIQAELASRGLPAASQIQILDPHTNDQARQSRHFKRIRQHGPEPAQDCGFLIQLDFEAPTTGPIALGYGSHLGLGVMGADADCGPLGAPSGVRGSPP